ncbi:MAG: type II toxin-antitoxin system VapB family antitoxin [Caldilineaceae bacterium]|nr:type II toxin-antitoxin system VapB family antitoxin [Caldilineaceae bacterium]
MRTNIVIDDELIAEAMRLTGIKTKRDVVEEALRILVRTSQQKNVLALRGQIQWDGDLDAMRQGRYLHESRTTYNTGSADTTGADVTSESSGERQ